ncbi:MAG TPA: hypothetical protein VFV99_33785 [Kofleriaceae bacterium]|nr:hypothetical protein [Kofleriaceae bacterium]
MRTSLVVIVLLLACSKSSSEQQAGSAAPPAASGSSGSSAAPAGSGSSAAPVEAATVVGPTRSVSGELDVSGLMSGKFQWIKKDQTSPISCAWSVEKEIGGLHVDLSDGAGHLLKMTIDVPPTEAGVPRLDVTSTGLPAPLKAKLGFNMSGEETGKFAVKFDTTLTENPDAEPAKKPGKKDEKPSGPSLTIKGTLEVTCPPKK